jgi:hypothetical protein
MKKSILGSFIGISIVLSIESFARVVAALTFDVDIPMFSYTAFPGIVTPVILTLTAAVSSFLGTLFLLTYGKKKEITSLILFVLMLLFLRYGQIHLLYDTESIVYPVIALILSLISVFIAWKILHPKKEEKENDFETKHHPVSDQREHPLH